MTTHPPAATGHTTRNDLHYSVLPLPDIALSYLHCLNPDARACIICLHGLASNATRWREYLEHTQLCQDSELVAVDLRGHGKSMTSQSYTRHDWCADIAALAASRARPTILIGHSLGAQVALEYAVRQPTTLQGLVLIDPVFPQALTGVLARVARLRGLIRMATSVLRLFYRLGLRRRHYPYRDLQQLDIETRTFLAANPHKGIADLYMNPFADLKYMPLANYLQDLYEVTRPLPQLDSITVPVLVLLSEGASTSAVQINREILATISECEIETLDADHWLLTERPEQARQVIDAWCAKRLMGS